MPVGPKIGKACARHEAYQLQNEKYFDVDRSKNEVSQWQGSSSATRPVPPYAACPLVAVDNRKTATSAARWENMGCRAPLFICVCHQCSRNM